MLHAGRPRPDGRFGYSGVEGGNLIGPAFLLFIAANRLATEWSFSTLCSALLKRLFSNHNKTKGSRVAPSPITMSYRIVWHGRLGEESSQLIDELERARIIADSLAARKKTIVSVIDAATRNVVYSTAQRPQEAAARSRRDSEKKRPPPSD